MRTNSVSNNSFKATYLIKGHTDLLDEICWYLQKKHVQNEAYTFVDIRNGIWFPGETGPLKHEAVDLFMTGDDEKLITPKLEDLVHDSVNENFVNHFQIPEFNPDRIENLDQQIVHENIKNIELGEESIPKISHKNILKECYAEDYAKFLYNNLAEMWRKIQNGKAILNINHGLVKQFHPTLKTSIPKVLDGEEVFAGIRRGSFDITEGVLV